jgi:parallel beta-helix repeat protein
MLATIRMVRRWVPGILVVGVAGAAAAIALVLTNSNASSQVAPTRPIKGCDRFASPSGNNRWAGTQKRPFATIPQLARSLRPGQVGCLLRGTYEQDQIVLGHGGVPGKPIRIRSAPGTRALVRGRLVIAANTSDIVISGIDFDGRNRINGASPTVLGDRIVFENNDVTNDHTEICFIIGSTTAVAEGVVLNGNRIHDCGKLPPQNQDHGIYVQHALNAVIENNYIYDNADRGIQLYPDAEGTLIQNNVIDGNGEGIIFSGGEQEASSNNTVRDNVISNSRVRSNIEYFYDPGAPTGQGNIVSHNCVYGAAKEDIDGNGIAFAAQDNVLADPLFVARDAKDFRLRDDSPCLWTAPRRTPPAAAS